MCIEGQVLDWRWSCPTCTLNCLVQLRLWAGDGLQGVVLRNLCLELKARTANSVLGPCVFLLVVPSPTWRHNGIPMIADVDFGNWASQGEFQSHQVGCPAVPFDKHSGATISSETPWVPLMSSRLCLSINGLNASSIVLDLRVCHGAPSQRGR